jgi:hypothetical protein
MRVKLRFIISWIENFLISFNSHVKVEKEIVKVGSKDDDGDEDDGEENKIKSKKSKKKTL